MSEDLNNTSVDTSSEVRQRLADRLGFLLAKRWIRTQQQSELMHAENQSRSFESKKGEISIRVEP
jgi:hypothetical protein